MRVHYFAAAVLTALLLQSAFPIAAKESNAERPSGRVAHMVFVKSGYRNNHFGFEVPMLAGVKAYRDAPPNPNHGVLYILGKGRTIAVSASYDAAEYGSTKVQLDRWLEGEPVERVERAPATLAGKPAEQATLHKTTTVTKVVAQRRDERGGILYELVLTTTDSHLARDGAKFEGIVASFRALKLPE